LFGEGIILTHFSNWKDATAKFAKHEGSQCHKDSVLKTITLPGTTSDVGEMLSSQLTNERLERRKCLLNLLSNACFLSRQGVAFCGDGEESDSNFARLIHLRSEDNTKLVDWIKQKTDRYTSGDMQNKMVKVMALHLLREIAGNLQSAPFFTVIVDETTDASNVEQVVGGSVNHLKFRRSLLDCMKWHQLQLRSSTLPSLMCSSG